jgi:hypothetical protein
MSEWIAGFDRYRSGGRGGSDRGSYLRLYNGGHHVVDRVGRGSFAVTSWSGCIIGGIQPGPIQKIAQEATEDGLLQRFIFSVPERQGRGEDRNPDFSALARYEALFPSLLNLSSSTVASYQGTGDWPVVVLSPEAHPYRLEIDNLAEAVAALPDTSPRLKAALGKWPGLFARLALCFHIIDAADASARGVAVPVLCVLREETARRVARFMREILLPHLFRAEAVMFATATSGHVRWIAGHILSQQRERVTARDIVHAYGALRPPERRRELNEVMESLVTMGWLRPEDQANAARPPSAWQVNPKIYSTFANRAAEERKGREAAREQIGETLRNFRKKAA